MKLVKNLYLLCVFMFVSSAMAQGSSTMDWIRAVEWNVNGDQIAFATQGGDIHIIDSQSSATTLILQQADHNAVPVYTLAWNANGTRLASGGTGNTITIWDVTSGQVAQSLQGGARQIRSLVWSPDGIFLAAVGQEGFPENIHVWNVASGEIVFSPIVGDALSIEWSPDGTRLAISKFGEIQLWNVAQQQVTQSIETPEYVVALAWSPDGLSIASADTFTPEHSVIRVWDVATRQLLYVLDGHDDVITSVNWSPTGDRLVTSSHDQRVHVWDVSTRSIIETYLTDDSVFAATFSPYGGRLAFGGEQIEVTSHSGTTPDDRSRVDNRIQIVVPIPSLERLNTIAELCVRDAVTQSRAVTDLTAQPLTALDILPDFVAQVEALPEDAIPVACRADLLAVAAALTAQE